MTTLTELKDRLAKLEARVKSMEESEYHKIAILKHMRKFRTRQSIMNKLVRNK